MLLHIANEERLVGISLSDWFGKFSYTTASCSFSHYTSPLGGREEQQGSSSVAVLFANNEVLSIVRNSAEK